MKDKVLSLLDLTPTEKDGLKMIWPHNLLENIYNMLYQYGEYKFLLSSGADRLDEDISEKWAGRVLDASLKLLSLSSLEKEEVIIDIISSNTHSVVNTLSPYIHSQKQNILDWGRREKSEFISQTPLDEQNLVYILASAYMKAHPHTFQERQEMEEKHGIVTVAGTNDRLTGITVQIINPKMLPKESHDEYVTPMDISTKKKHLIVNIDFCFGNQAEDILGCLILVFVKFS